MLNLKLWIVLSNYLKQNSLLSSSPFLFFFILTYPVGAFFSYRIIAVFVSGPAWQFEGVEWKKCIQKLCPPRNEREKPNIAQLFKTVKGFYLSPDGKAIPPDVTTWDVESYQISYAQPHTIKTAQLGFWETVHQHLAKKEFAWRSGPAK